MTADFEALADRMIQTLPQERRAPWLAFRLALAFGADVHEWIRENMDYSREMASELRERILTDDSISRL